MMTRPHLTRLRDTDVEGFSNKRCFVDQHQSRLSAVSSLSGLLMAAQLSEEPVLQADAPMRNHDKADGEYDTGYQADRNGERSTQNGGEQAVLDAHPDAEGSADQEPDDRKKLKE
jgi:hypothetical protein